MVLSIAMLTSMGSVFAEDVGSEDESSTSNSSQISINRSQLTPEQQEIMDSHLREILS